MSRSNLLLLAVALAACSGPDDFPAPEDGSRPVRVVRRNTTCVDQPEYGQGTAEVEVGYRPMVLQSWTCDETGACELGTVESVADGIATVKPCGGYVMFTVAAGE
jgi:hypothetical protein